MPDFRTKKILVTPLDWGLGHATRCIPIINEFLKQGCEVQIATSGDALILLKKEFPGLKIHSIASYQAEYSLILPFAVKVILQGPKFLSVITNEHKETEEIVNQEKIDLIISDNRYGCWSRQAKSIFVGHQLKFKTRVFSSWFNRLNESAVKKFSACWVPDNEGANSLAGELAINPKLKPIYIGNLSRMKWHQLPSQYEILAIISGPEPQRTAFEKLVLPQLVASNKRCLAVLGQPQKIERRKVGNVEIVSHMNSQDLNTAMLQSELIISRSGYSTIMDVAALGLKAIFVPTPGQIEQEYLADLLMKKKITFSMTQDKFNLQDASAYSNEYSGFEQRQENVVLAKIVERTINEIG